MSTNTLFSQPVWRIPLSDKVWLATIAIFVFTLVLDEYQFLESAKFVGSTLLYMLPIILLASAAAAYAKASGFDQQISRVFSNSPVKAIVLASLFGALSPFCSCGVIALVAGMLRAGVPLAPVMAFWISSPIMDPEMFVLTSAILGVPFAVAKTLSAFSMGILSGAVVALLGRVSFIQAPLKNNQPTCGGEKVIAEPGWKIWQSAERKAVFKAETSSTLSLLLKWLTLAFLLESLMLAYIPTEWVNIWLVNEAWWNIPLVATLGAPLYLNGYAAIPLASGLLEQGMAPGAALAFLVGGGVTSIPAAMSVYALVRKPLFVLYILLGLSGAIAAGLLYQAFI